MDLALNILAHPSIVVNDIILCNLYYFFVQHSHRINCEAQKIDKKVDKTG